LSLLNARSSQKEDINYLKEGQVGPKQY
jgi:hypothetical protein